MNIATVCENLKRTIANKEYALEQHRAARREATSAEDIALHAVVECLKVNLEELKRILADVEACEELTS